MNYSGRVLSMLVGASAMLLFLVLPARAQSPGANLISEKMLKLINSDPLQAQDGDDEMRKLLVERSNIALDGLKNAHSGFLKGTATLVSVFDNGRRFQHTQLRLTDNKDVQMSIVKAHLAILEELENLQDAQSEALGSKNTTPILTRIRYAKVTARINMLHLKRNEPIEYIVFNP